MTELDIAYQRLNNQRISRPTLTRPEDVVRWMGALQAQDYLYSLWAIGLRMQNAIEANVEQAIADRTILRTWPMRGTVHFVLAEDAAWMLKLLSQQVINSRSSVRRKAGLDDPTITKSRKILATTLQGKQLTRKEVYDALERGGIRAYTTTSVGSRGLHIIGQLALEGFICFGSRKGKQPTFVLLDEWVPNPRKLKRDEALAKLAGRYFRSHGPATDYDFAWWSGLKLSEARTGIEMIRSSLAKEKFGDKMYWCTSLTSTRVKSAKAFLLPYFDEYTVAYKDRSVMMDRNVMKQYGAGREVGILAPVVVMNGQIVGLWKRTIEKKRVVIATNHLPIEIQKAVAAAVQRYGRFIGLPVSS